MADTGTDVSRALPVELTPRDVVKNKSRRRLFLLLLGPILVLAGLVYFYFATGRYVGTDNAYVRATKVQVSADIPGRVTAIFVKENQSVKAGDLLFQLDPEPLRLAIDQARAHLNDVRNSIIALKASYRQREEELKGAQSTYQMTQSEFNRRQKLLAGKIISTTEFEEARNQFEVAASHQAMVQQDISEILSQLGGNPDIVPEEHARYREAEAQLAQAELDLRHGEIHAPRDGTVSQIDQLSVGDYIQVGQPLFALVDQAHPWIEANLKETDLTYVEPGQSASVAIDTYSGVELAGRVLSIGAGTGAEFSILPPQNATGNWVKIVQRVPVRIELISDNARNIAFRAGMSAVISIDTGPHHTFGNLVRTVGRWLGLTS